MSQTTEGYFDIQVNGYAGVDLNAEGLTAESFRTMCQRLEADGVSGVLATVITAPLETMCHRIARLVELREADTTARRIIAGIHVEGPFISPEEGFIGAHPRQAVRPADPEIADRLLDAGEGLVRLVTLAPERDTGLATTRHLVRRGVAVAAGHCNPSRDELRAAIDAGLCLFTHLGNGCPKQLDRHDNIVQRVLSLSDHLSVSFIADGIHIPPWTLGNYLRCVPPERAIVVTDAMAAAGCPPGRYRLGTTEVEVDAEGAARLPGTPYLAGSTATMPGSARLLRDALGLDPMRMTAMTVENPRRVIGLD